MKAALANLKAAGCKRAYLDGSFITQKEKPADYDLCWEPKGVEFALLDPLFCEARFCVPPRTDQKKRYLGEVILTVPIPYIWDHLSFFQENSRTGEKKGIILIELEELP